MKISTILLIMFIPALALMGSGRPVAAAGSDEMGLVLDSWQVTVSDDEAVVTRTVQIDERITPLVRGNGALQPASLEAFLRANGAHGVTCGVQDRIRQLAVTCRYRQALSGPEVALPDDTFLHFLLDLPVDAAQGVQIDSTGELAVPGLVAGIPPAQRLSLGNGGSYFRRYGVSDRSTLVIVGETRLMPGQFPLATMLMPVVIPYLPPFQPRPSAWLAMIAGLAVALLAVGRLLPVGARLPLRPRLWQPDLSRLPRLLLWLARHLVRLVNWLQVNWPRLLNAAVGSALSIAGVQILLAAWGLARLHDKFADPGAPFPATLPLLPPVELLAWPGWPFVVAGFGAILLATGAGLLARRETARLLVVGVTMALAGGLILTWPRILLAPPLFPAQLELVLVSGSAALLALVLFARGLMHPQFRRYYLAITDHV